MIQRCFGGVRLLDGLGPSLLNVDRLDKGAWPYIQACSRTGLMVDLDHFKKMEIELTQDLDRITEDVHTLTGYYINLSSGDQKADLLFKKLGLKQARTKMTKSGERESVEDEVLTAIQHDHPVVPLMLEYTEYDKLRGTYVVPMPKLAKHVAFGEWRMFPNFTTTRVPSGRLSCKDPNLLAMPTRTERGREIRKGFITKDGWCYVSCDESQIEVRLAAHCSQDPNLIKVYQNEEDVYSDFATTAFQLRDERFKSPEGKWKYPTVDPRDHRRPSKTCVLAAIYDVTAAGLLEQLPVVCAGCNLEATKHTCNKFHPLWTENKAQDLLNSFYQRYPGILHDRKRNHAIARSKAYIYDIWGRILHAQAVRSIHPWVVSACLREVGNFPYQAGAGGTLKLAEAQVYDDLEGMGMLAEQGGPVECAIPVHDEMVFTAEKRVAQDLGELVKYRFETCCQLRVPIKAEWVTATTWGSLEK